MNVLYVIFLIIAIFILLKRLIPSKGAMGEKRVARILEKLPEEKYSVITYLLLNNGYTSQVDHVVVSVHGFFVIETKTYQGIKNSERWSQKIAKKEYALQMTTASIML